MQSPLTPQRGRIESNPREYTHMGPRLCGELETMPTDWTMPSARLLHERGFPDARQTRVEIRTHERGISDGYRTRVDFRTESAVKSPKTVQISTLDFKLSDNPRSYGARCVPRACRAPSRAAPAHTPHPAISRTARRNLRQSRYNSPMRIAHDDDIGARDWGRIHGRATDNAGD